MIVTLCRQQSGKPFSAWSLALARNQVESEIKVGIKAEQLRKALERR